MSNPYVGEIRMFGGTFAPAGWASCAGQLMPISQNDILFNLIGTTYGGDGQETFGLPDLQGRAPVHAGKGPGLSQNYQLGEKSGVESVTLTTQQIPVHNHAFLGSTDFGQGTQPQNGVFASISTGKLYVSSAPGATLASNALSVVGGSQPHDNMQPYLAITFIISLFGVFPTQT
jgi:microcystin-dependent protein